VGMLPCLEGVFHVFEKAASMIQKFILLVDLIIFDVR
jgi:hypothetical protein